eukprot:7760492-Ditylum_brightwellii.AAC.1
MNCPDAPLFVGAMKEELDMLEALEVWELIGIDKVPLLPNGSPRNIIESTWAFKVKRFPDGGVKKRKARLSVCGDQQVKDVDYFEIYAPVVSWATIHTIITLAVNLGLKSRQVDYTNAFVQATLPPDE